MALIYAVEDDKNILEMKQEGMDYGTFESLWLDNQKRSCCSLRNGVRRRGQTGGTIRGLRNGVRRRGPTGGTI